MGNNDDVLIIWEFLLSGNIHVVFITTMSHRSFSLYLKLELAIKMVSRKLCEITNPINETAEPKRSIFLNNLRKLTKNDGVCLSRHVRTAALFPKKGFNCLRAYNHSDVLGFSSSNLNFK